MNATAPLCDSVYAGTAPMTHSVSVVSDATPNMLAKVFGLLATFSFVPSVSESYCCGDDHIEVRMVFKDVEGARIDLLRRKIMQLTETVSVEVAEIC